MAKKRIDGRHCEDGIYEAFVEGKLQAPKHLARTVHDLYLDPKYNEFRSWDDLEPVQRVYVGIQETEPHSPIQGDSEAGRVPGSSILAVVLS